MDKEILFTETQKFKQWWLWLIFIAINSFFLTGVYLQIFSGRDFIHNALGDNELLLATVITLALTLLFMNFRLETQIKTDGVYVRFFPFHLVFKYYPWKDISKTYFREYHPIRDYGGWGIRYSLFGKGKAYNISGNKGLQLELLNSKKLLIGTGKEEELKEILQKLGKLNP